VIGAVGLLRAVLVLQLSLGVAAGAWALLPGDPRSRVRDGRRLLGVALLVPLFVAYVPVDAPFEPPAQVWSAADWHGTEPVASLAIPGVEKPVAVVAARRPLDAGVVLVGILAVAGAVGLARTLLGVRSLLGSAVRWRRIRGVDLLVSAATPVPCTLWLGRPIVVLDPDTFADPAARLLAVRHELQHQRAGDAAFAWMLAGIGVIAFANPAVVWWRRRLADTEELACDAALLEAGVEAAPYARVLLAAAERAVAPLAFPGLLSRAPNLLSQRIAMLLAPPSRSAGSPFALVLAIPLIAGVAWAGDRAISDRRVSMADVEAVAAHASEGSDFPIAGNSQVRDALDRMIATRGGRRWVTDGLQRHDAMAGRFEAALEAVDLPLELAAVPLVESGYQNMTGDELDPSLPARSRGAGFWMFIPATAREYGMTVDASVDQRRDVDRETAAAIALFRHDFARYHDWNLALAAYNQGAAKVDTAIAAGGTRDVWELQDQGLLNDYVAQIQAAILLIDDPSLIR
jgi:membrane-bound lytic murein transglycosylase D